MYVLEFRVSNSFVDVDDLSEIAGLDPTASMQLDSTFFGPKGFPMELL